MFVRPASAEDKIPLPEGGLLPAEGTDVPMTSYWCRLVVDGTVVKGKAKAAKPVNTKSKETKQS